MINVVFPVLNEELRLEKGIQTVVPFLSEHWMGNFQIKMCIRDRPDDAS